MSLLHSLKAIGAITISDKVIEKVEGESYWLYPTLAVVAVLIWQRVEIQSLIENIVGG